METQAPELIGRIASVLADGGFVLIQKLGAKELPGGTVLTSRGTEDRAANLLVTGESLGQFAAADVRTGHVQVGDGVYSHHSPAPQPTPETAGENTEGIENKIVTEDESAQKNN